MEAVAFADYDDAAATPRSASRRVPYASTLALWLILAGYLATMCLNFSPAISEPDDNGYFAQASLLFTTGHTWFRPASDAQYVGMHWLLTPDGNYVSRYPPGLAVLIGVVYATLGYKAAVFVNPALSVLMLLGAYFLGRRIGLSRWWAVGATLLLASNPTVLHHALSGDSHMSVACVLVWGMFLLVRWAQEGRPWLMFAAGVVLGTIPTIRYPDAIMAGGLGAFVLWNLWAHRPIARHLLAGVGGALIPVLPLLVRNQLLLGGFWKTGYALTNEQTGFSWAYFTQHALQYVGQIHSGGLGPMFALGVIGLATMLCTRSTRAIGAMFTLIALPMLLLYMAYYWAPQNSGATMRFLLPTFPAYVLAGVWAVSEMTKAAPRAARVAVPLVLIGVQSLWATQDVMNQFRRMAGAKTPLAIVTQRIDETVGPGDVIIANGNLLQHLDYVRKWKIADASLAGGVRGGGPGGGGGGPGGGGPPMGGGMGGPPGMGGPMGGMGGMMGGDGADQPSPMQAEKRALQAKLYPGTTRAKQANFAADVSEWSNGGAIYLVGTEGDVKLMLGAAIGADALEIVKRFSAPPTQQGMGGGGPPGGGPGTGGRGGMGGGINGNRNNRAAEPARPVTYVIAKWNATAE